MSLIDTFLDRYRRTFDRYERAALLCKQQCEIGLCSVRCDVRARAKSFASLRRKLLLRDAQKGYATFEAIEQDIADLAGIRIALYFPGEFCKVDKFIRSHFELETDGIRYFPKAETSLDAAGSSASERKPCCSGYHAVHFRARSRPENLARSDADFAGVRIEIQVASVLMHAWAEVEHDLVYKPRPRGIPETVRSRLDEVNGIVHEGETALDRLHRSLSEAGGWSDPFEDPYELSAYLRATLPRLAEADECGDILMGPADLLLRMLSLRGLDSPDCLKAALADFHLGDASEHLPAAARIIVHLLLSEPEAAGDYVRARDYVNRPRGITVRGDQQAEIVRFMERWFRFARATRMPRRAAVDCSAQGTHVVDVARRYCDEILRCVEVPAAEDLAAVTLGIEDLLGSTAPQAS
jgi:ppGpp synthetase/RelA/SpoT-type nucleotidyltranferase